MDFDMRVLIQPLASTRTRAAWFALLLAAPRPAVEAASLEVKILPRFGGAPLIFDALTNKTSLALRPAIR